MQRSGYSFVAAANLYKNYGGLAIYARFRKTGNPHISIKECGKNFIWYECPDRELLLVRDSFAADSFRPHGFDLCVDLNTFNDQVSESLGLEYVMTNYTHDRVNTNRGAVKPANRKVQILSDSGGLQVIRDTVDIINPLDLISFYNTTVDAGMVLDLPLLVQDSALAKKAGDIQRRSNNVLLKNRRPGVELINIFHGTTIEDRKRYRGYVEDENIERVAIGGLLRMSYITGVNVIYEMLKGKRYSQYHALGVFALPYLALLVKIANSGDNPPHITSDSTSHVQASLNNVYHVQYSDSHPMNRIPIGSKSSASANRYIYLQCDCPVCHTLKYRDIFSFGHNRFNGFLALHNAIEMARYTSSLQEACRQLSPSQYNKYVMHQLKNSQDKHELHLALDYIDVVVHDGLAKAQKKYQSHLNKWKLPPSANGNSLFSSPMEDGLDVSVKDWYAITTKKLEQMDNLLHELGE